MSDFYELFAKKCIFLSGRIYLQFRPGLHNHDFTCHASFSADEQVMQKLSTKQMRGRLIKNAELNGLRNKVYSGPCQRLRRLCLLFYFSHFFLRVYGVLTPFDKNTCHIMAKFGSQCRTSVKKSYLKFKRSVLE